MYYVLFTVYSIHLLKGGMQCKAKGTPYSSSTVSSAMPLLADIFEIPHLLLTCFVIARHCTGI